MSDNAGRVYPAQQHLLRLHRNSNSGIFIQLLKGRVERHSARPNGLGVGPTLKSPFLMGVIF